MTQAKAGNKKGVFFEDGMGILANAGSWLEFESGWLEFEAGWLELSHGWLELTHIWLEFAPTPDCPKDAFRQGEKRKTLFPSAKWQLTGSKWEFEKTWLELEASWLELRAIWLELRPIWLELAHTWLEFTPTPDCPKDAFRQGEKRKPLFPTAKWQLTGSKWEFERSKWQLKEPKWELKLSKGKLGPHIQKPDQQGF